MQPDILSLVSFSGPIKPEAIEYLQKAISKEVVAGLHSFVSKQSQVFNEHANSLSEILRVIDTAPPAINLNWLQDAFVAWLRENGVSSSRITQLKGYMRLRCRALGPDSRYSNEEKMIIASPEVEKAYLFGRLTFEGQDEAFKYFREDGRLTLRDLRELLKDNTYDPSSKWRGGCDESDVGLDPMCPDMSRPADQLSEDLACKLQEVIDQFVGRASKWENDRRVINLLDYRKVRALYEAIKPFNDDYFEDEDLLF